MEGSSNSDGFLQIILKAALEAVPVLTDENYSIWKEKMTILLELKGVKEALEDETKTLKTTDDMEIRVILLSQIDSITHNNVVNPTNITSAKLLWQTIKERFSSSQTANRARIFNEFLYLQFKTDLINLFITETKISMKKMIDVGIDLPDDILAYLILFKFPSTLQSLRQQIMHSDKSVSVKLVLNHLTQLNNETKSNAQDVKTTLDTALVVSRNVKKPLP